MLCFRFANVERREMKAATLVAIALIGLTMAHPRAASGAGAEDIKVGMIGLDTSHAIAFTQVLNNDNDPSHVSGAKVVAAYKGGSNDIESSYSRVEEYTKELQEKFGVKIYDTIDEMCKHVDAVMLESVDGRPHLEQVKPVIAAKKPVFIDKPMAGSLHDVIEIFRLAEEANVPCFSSSSYRYYESLTSLMKEDYGDVRSCISIGPCHLEPHHPDLFWYGVHAVEALYTVMGAGCETVVRTTTPDSDVVTGTWKDGRVGVFYGIRTSGTPHKAVIFGSKSVVEQKGDGNYAPLVAEIVKFFQSGVAPVPAEETINMFAFMEAADASKNAGGVPVKISDIMAKAQAE
jgi:predicted dehydrogenase